MNINPKIWGRNTWDFFYYVALSYPKNPTQQDKIKFKNFYTLAGSIVPCKKCQDNFAKHLIQLPIDNYLNSSYNLFSWVNQMDNKVRKLHNQQEYTVEESFQFYMDKISEENSLSIINLSSKEKMLIGMGVVLVFLIIFKKYRFI